ncbi:MAG: acetylornithine deacetylase [Ferrovibrio sp.]|uniref:acetylornithine deacetylase n=1 Tax=Ferrovibrio sp. TaxID=1917215 RepID=UPI00391DCB52
MTDIQTKTPPTKNPSQAALDWIERLIAFDTTSRLSNLALIDDIAAYLAQHGVASDKIYDSTGRKANLYATIGPRDVGGIVLSGHTDVVPVDGQPWTSDPFKVVQRGSRLYGRGTSDMKSFIALCLALLPEMLNQPLSVPLHFAFSYDEEVGCLGVHGIVDFVKQGGPAPRLAIIGEPTEMQVVNAHKSVCACNTTVHGFEAHSSATHQGVNAIQVAGELIAEMNRIQREYQKPEYCDPRFEPPYTTITVGEIHGGTARNILARECKLVWDIRAVKPEHDHAIVEAVKRYATEQLEPGMKRIHAQAGVDTQVVAHVPAFLPVGDNPAETLALKLAGQNRTQAVSYGTEAGIFHVGGIPAVVCGPGNIREAHKPDEYIELSQVAEGEAFLHRLIAFCRDGGSRSFLDQAA